MNKYTWKGFLFMKKTNLNQSLRCFLVALSMLLVFYIVVSVIPAYLSNDALLKYNLQNDYAKHWFLNTAAIIYSVIAASFAVMGTVFNQKAKCNHDKAISSFVFLLVGIASLIAGYYLIAYSKTADCWLTTTVSTAFFALYFFFSLFTIVCFFLFLVTEITLKIKSASSVKA